MVQAPAKPEIRAEVGIDPHPLPAPVTLKLPDGWEPTDEALIELSRLNDTWRFELTAQRELVIMSPEGRGSSRRGAEILTDLDLEQAVGGGYVLGPQAGIRLPDSSMRMPDVAWMSAQRWDDHDADDESLAQSCPELIVEIVSVTDVSAIQQEKMVLWIENGALLGWLIDPYQEAVSVYRPDAEVEQLERPDSLSGEDVCEGLEVSLERIWK